MTRGEFQKELKKLSNLFEFELGSLRRDLANIKKEVEKKKKKEGKQFGAFKESPF